MKLFVRAHACGADSRVTEANAWAVAAVCEKLEGLPLALELLAAARGCIDAGADAPPLSHRLDLLVTGQPDVGPRHRSMRAALEWGIQLLKPAVRQFFAQMSVFRSGWTLEAAPSGVWGWRWRLCD